MLKNKPVSISFSQHLSLCSFKQETRKHYISKSNMLCVVNSWRSTGDIAKGNFCCRLPLFVAHLLESLNGITREKAGNMDIINRERSL